MGNKWTLLGILLGLSSCSNLPIERKRATIIKCVKDLIGYEVDGIEAYNICKDLYSPRSKKNSDNNSIGQDKVSGGTASGHSTESS